MKTKIDKSYAGMIKLKNIIAGNAMQTTGLAAACGPKGLKLPDIVTLLNNATKKYTKGSLVAAKIFIFKGKKPEIIIQNLSVSEMVKSAINLKMGAKNPGSEKVGKITMKQIIEIAKIKLEDSNISIHDEEGIPKMCKTIMGTCKAMGVEVL